MTFVNGWHQQAMHCPSPFYNQRPNAEIGLIVIHNISLPAGHFGTGFVEQLFLGDIDCSCHPSFESLIGVEVSAHFLIARDGSLTQFVNVNDRAWHAGVSEYQGRESCNDFSIGIELEGTDTCAYTDKQYDSLTGLVAQLMQQYHIEQEHVVGHCDIAPGRKTDPGESFDWQRFRCQLAECL